MSAMAEPSSSARSVKMIATADQLCRHFQLRTFRQGVERVEHAPSPLELVRRAIVQCVTTRLGQIATADDAELAALDLQQNGAEPGHQDYEEMRVSVIGSSLQVAAMSARSSFYTDVAQFPGSR